MSKVPTKDEINDRVRRVITEQLGVNARDIQNDSRLKENLGADELDVVEMAMALEDEFSLNEITDEMVGERKDDPTVAEWVDIVEKLLDEAKPRQSVTR